jgi:hypothetical protein
MLLVSTLDATFVQNRRPTDTFLASAALSRQFAGK